MLRPALIFVRCRSYCVYTSGPQGVEGRLPNTFQKGTENECQSVVITDPYVLYQSYVKLGMLEMDESQVRVMKEFQKLYYRVVDYKPAQDMAIRTSLLLRKLEIRHAEELRKVDSLLQEPLYKFKQWFRKDISSQKRDIVRFMTDEEELHNIASPQGLLVNGEVGCGKSMLMDIFAKTLPYDSKMRWHYNNFILWVFGEIHKIQKERMLTASVDGIHKMTMENEFILFEIAQKMISKSTVFMLDEFMLPDVASAQIIRILFTYYFKLGGVLVATSNKLPEELYSSAFNKSRFKSFSGILNSRCVAVDMKSEMDYRLHFAKLSSQTQNMVTKEKQDHDYEWNLLIKSLALRLDETFMDPKISLEDLNSEPATFTVYNRTTELPMTFNNNTVCYVSFEYICKGLFSASDYITLASIYNTVIIDHVPVMTAKMKNEARRFITLLDALYEARCQFYMRSEVDVDRLFFPEEANEQETSTQRVQEEEMYAKTTMAATSPYRPNVASYDKSYAKEYDDSKKQANVNFGNVKAFTGEDEKFAYKRAVLRIREMVASDHWRSSDRWIPIDESMRPWEEKSGAPKEHKLPRLEHETASVALPVNELKSDLQTLLPRDLSALYGMTFREFNTKAAPIFSSLLHFWSMGIWTLDQQKRIKDKIAQAWVGGVRKP